MQNTSSLILSGGDCRLTMGGHHESSEEQVVVEESFPIMTIPIQTPLVPPPNVVADIAPATTPTQAHAGVVPIHSPFWLLDNHDNSLAQPVPFMIPPWYYPQVNQGTNTASQFPIVRCNSIAIIPGNDKYCRAPNSHRKSPFRIHNSSTNTDGTNINSSTSRYAQK